MLCARDKYIRVLSITVGLVGLCSINLYCAQTNRCCSNYDVCIANFAAGSAVCSIIQGLVAVMYARPEKGDERAPVRRRCNPLVPVEDLASAIRLRITCPMYPVDLPYYYPCYVAHIRHAYGTILHVSSAGKRVALLVTSAQSHGIVDLMQSSREVAGGGYRHRCRHPTCGRGQRCGTAPPAASTALRHRSACLSRQTAPAYRLPAVLRARCCWQGRPTPAGALCGRGPK